MHAASFINVGRNSKTGHWRSQAEEWQRQEQHTLTPESNPRVDDDDDDDDGRTLFVNRKGVLLRN